MLSKNKLSECMMEMRQDSSAGASCENMGDRRQGQLAQAHGAHGYRGFLLLLPQTV